MKVELYSMTNDDSDDIVIEKGNIGVTESCSNSNSSQGKLKYPCPKCEESFSLKVDLKVGS